MGISDEHIDPVRGDVFLRRLQHLHRSGVGIVLHPGPDEESLRPVPQVLVVKQDVPGHVVVALLKIRVAADIVKIQFPRFRRRRADAGAGQEQNQEQCQGVFHQTGLRQSNDSLKCLSQAFSSSRTMIFRALIRA